MIDLLWLGVLVAFILILLGTGPHHPDRICAIATVPASCGDVR
jgi:hypothetical protein